MSLSIEELGLASRARAEAAMRERSLFDLEALIETLPPVRGFAARLHRNAGPRPRIIAGIERTTPEQGPSRQVFRPRQIAMGYARVGAAALSVATEPDQSGGDLDHISEVRPAHLPILRNDFLVTPYQIAQSRVAGADAVLLIARLLTGATLGIMIAAAGRYGVEPLIEVRDQEELDRTVQTGTQLLAIRLDDTAGTRAGPGIRLRSIAKMPQGMVTVARGRIDGPADVEHLHAEGFDALLVEGQLMRAEDPADALWALMQPAS